MNVIITLAGHSRRFKSAGYQMPKFLLPVGGLPMIRRVVDMFESSNDHFHFVINELQLAEQPDLVDFLRSLVARGTVVVIPPHEKGPTFSALQVVDIGDDEEVIVAYCDFVVAWDYQQFLRHARGHDGAVPSFRGFHPASFGTTYFAYMRTDGDRMLELREKRNFTDDRVNEPASVGTYYFRSWALFRHYAERLLARSAGDTNEAYVSLLYNDMVQDGLEVVIHAVDRFLCLGTPADFEQYAFWWQYFHETQTPLAQDDGATRAVNLIPLAGRGSRFRHSGYRVAKPLIRVRGEPMVIRASRSMPPASRWIFLPNAEDLRKCPIEATLRQFEPECVVIPVNGLTSGQAATCLLAEEYLSDDVGLLIASCDYEHRYDPIAWQAILTDPTIDGAIWTYRMHNLPMKDAMAFAYARVGPDGHIVSEVVEKRTISDHPGEDPLVVGTFWYRRARDFVRGVRMMIERGITVNGEHYVGTSINTLLEEGHRFVIFEATQWIPFGDPFELQVLEYWEDYFTSS